MLLPIATIALLAWLFLLTCRGGFWRADCRLGPAPERERDWPAVTAVVPARDEADVIEPALLSLLKQDYPGALRVVLVDDDSGDGTTARARALTGVAGRSEILTIVESAPLPPGWSGKLWAVQQGIERAEALEAGESPPRYIWLSDADIVVEPDLLRRLIAKAEDDGRDLVSLMALLEHEGHWARLLIPPFVFFFQKLYPFPWSNDRDARTAAAAGGCNLVRAEALAAAGGITAIRDALIDDCALAALIKGRARPGTAPRGRGIWLGLTEAAVSIRPYRALGEVWRMVARTAYTQLQHSPWLLAGTLVGMALLYLAPPLIPLTLPLHGEPLAAGLAAAAWLAMAFAAWPTYRLYREPPWRCLLLPMAALLYTAMTFDSALQHWHGRGGRWKGRVQAPGQQAGDRQMGAADCQAAPLEGPRSGG